MQLSTGFIMDLSLALWSDISEPYSIMLSFALPVIAISSVAALSLLSEISLKNPTIRDGTTLSTTTSTAVVVNEECDETRTMQERQQEARRGGGGEENTRTNIQEITQSSSNTIEERRRALLFAIPENVSIHRTISGRNQLLEITT